MKGLLLDTINQEIKEVDCNPDIHEWYKLLHCDIVEMPERSIGGKYYTIICDEEGRLKENLVSAINSINNIMLVGSLLIFNTDYENCDVKSLTEEDIIHIKKYVHSLKVINTITGEAKTQNILTEVEY